MRNALARFAIANAIGEDRMRSVRLKDPGFYHYALEHGAAGSAQDHESRFGSRKDVIALVGSARPFIYRRQTPKPMTAQQGGETLPVAPAQIDLGVNSRPGNSQSACALPLPPASTSPPLAPLALRVGVTGHRPNPAKGRAMPDVARLRSTLSEILRHINDAFDGVAQAHGGLFDLQAGPANPKRRGSLRVISALAEGADQWAADEARKLDYELQSPLPFPREEYEKDFSDPAVVTEFRRLLGQATSVMELDGRVDVDKAGIRKPSSAAYEAVGRAVLNQTDLLLAIWDGQAAQGRGGTGAVVVEALQRGIPVVWVNWAQPDTWTLRLPEWRLLQRAADLQGDAERLKELVQQLLLPSRSADGTEHNRPTTRREDYFRETQKCGNPLHGCWQLFLGFVTGAIFQRQKLRELFAGKPFQVANFEASTCADWERECADTILDRRHPHPAAPQLAEAVDRSYLRHYAWANQLSVYYANLYRSAFALCYLLAAAAVFFALVPMAARWEHGRAITCIGAELVVILGILGLTLYGRRCHWHERWIDYRTLAERLRLARCLALLGGGGQQASLAGHPATFGNPAGTWMHWHFIATERAAGLPGVRLTADYLKASQQFWLNKLIEDQINYHESNRARCEKLDHRVHWAGGVLFAATFAVCVLHFFSTGTASGWLTLGAACFPALAAALAAIRSQAEAPRLARRSFAMQKSLEQMKLDLASVATRAGEGNSEGLRMGVDRVTDLMVKETLDWRVVLLDRPLEVHI